MKNGNSYVQFVFDKIVFGVLNYKNNYHRNKNFTECLSKLFIYTINCSKYFDSCRAIYRHTQFTININSFKMLIKNFLSVKKFENVYKFIKSYLTIV